MVKRILFIFISIMLILVNLSIAETPFTDKPVKDTSQQKDNKLPVSAPPLPDPSVGIPIPGQVDGTLPFKEKLVVKGKVNNKVVVVNSQGEQLTVNDGEIVSGCLIKYPEVICDPQKISRINLDKKNKELEKQLSLKNQEIEKLKKEVERFMKERESLKKEVDKLKKENLELQEKAKALSKEKEVVEKNVERLKTEQSVLENKLKAIEKERNDLDSQLKDLKKEISALREVNKSIADKEA
ncbi:MAG: hypothetical protein NZ942_03040, partial [Candidatus Aenigmarchaeota archaeon]|nr:hypothetical protein [Candidatus Aenigmarchaeota archaeon]